MRILRVRRGFTTNSSASSEWIPPEANPPRPSLNESLHVTKVVLPVGATPPPQAVNWGDAAKVGGLISIVAAFFVAERAARSIVRRVRGNKENVTEESADED